MLVGLTIEETVEFERLDGLQPLNGGNVLWQEPDLSCRQPAKALAELPAPNTTFRLWVQWIADRRQPKRKIYPSLTKFERFSPAAAAVGWGRARMFQSFLRARAAKLHPGAPGG